MIGGDDLQTPPPQDGLAHPQFVATDVEVEILAIHGINAVEEATAKQSEKEEGDDVLLQSALLASLDQDNGDKHASLVVVTKQRIEGMEFELEEEMLMPDDVSDYGSGCICLQFNDRLLMLECLPRYITPFGKNLYPFFFLKMLA